MTTMTSTTNQPSHKENMTSIMTKAGTSVDAAVRRTLDFALSYTGLSDGKTGRRHGFELTAWAEELGVGRAENASRDAVAIAKARKEGGLWIPRYDLGALDEWFIEARTLGLTSDVAVAGAVVLYTYLPNGAKEAVLERGRGNRLVVSHIGLVVCTAPKVMSIESDTWGRRRTGAGAHALTVREVDSLRVLCFILPQLSNEGGNA